MKRLLSLVLLTMLSGCVVPEPLKAPPPPPPPPPLTLPLPDGRAAEIMMEDNYRYVVNYQSLDQAQRKVFLRVARATAPDMTYSDGLLAKKVAEAYCAQYNRQLNPVAYGMFSTPSAWMFEGGCT